jgi:hypothetical protein
MHGWDPSDLARWNAQADADLLRALNALVVPLVMAGAAAPGFWPAGMIVLETAGATAGPGRSVPLLATMLDGCALVSTWRGRRSRWMRDLAARPRVRYWLGGREQRGHARVFAPGACPPAMDGLPPLVRMAAHTLWPATLVGWAFAVIGPA